MTTRLGVVLRCSSGDKFLSGHPDQTIAAILLAHGVPTTSVQLRVENALGHGIGVLSELSDLGTASRRGVLVAYVTRNYDPTALFTRRPSIDRERDWVTEWSFPAGSNDHCVTQVGISALDAMNAAIEACESTFRSNELSGLGDILTVGYSGGGDSNLLLKALSRAESTRTRGIQPVFVCGIDDWDRQLPHARHISAELGFALKVVLPSDSARYAGLESIPAAKERFSEAFPGVGLEFFGTWLLRKVLMAVADENGGRVVVFGYNREDVLAEALLRVCSGLLPLKFPVRRLARTQLVSPLYQLPKKIIDAAFSDSSIANYQNRDSSFDVGRSMLYHVCHVLSTQTPGFDVALLNGLQSLAAADTDIAYDPELDDLAVGYVPSELKEKWKRVFAIPSDATLK